MPVEKAPSAGPFDNRSEARTEKHRLAAVRRYDILDTPPDGAFDRITALASRIMRVPVGIVSIVDHDRIWFKSRHGLDVEQIDRDPGLCASCILQDGPWIVNNAKTDPRTLANPLVAKEAGVQFYLGIPLRTPDGFNLGTLCVLDFVPRAASEHEVSILNTLAAVVMDELELRLSARNAVSGYQDELARRELREEYIRALMGELAHRAKNLLAVVQAIARQTAPQSQTVEDYVSRLAARVQGLAHTHDLIADEDWHGVTLDDLAARQLSPFVEDEGTRVHYEGPHLVLSPVAHRSRIARTRDQCGQTWRTVCVAGENPSCLAVQSASSAYCVARARWPAGSGAFAQRLRSRRADTPHPGGVEWPSYIVLFPRRVELAAGYPRHLCTVSITL